MIPDLIFFLRNLASKFQTVFYSFSGPPFPPKNLIQVFPEGASATSVYLQWAEIPVTEQGGGLDNYEILYWVVGPPGQFNKVYLPIGQPASTEGFIRYEIQHLQTSLEYKVAVYGKNQYSTNVLDQSYYSTEISVIPSAERMY